MSVPGSNLLSAALGLIASQPVQYLQNTGRATNSAGVQIATFAPAITVSQGSVQPVPRSRFQVLGLSMEKSYVTWFVSRNVVGLERDYSGDRIQYAGRVYQLESETEWFHQDGWISVICVDIGPVVP